MKISELIRELQNTQEIEGDLEIEFGYDYGDHGHTTVTEGINSVTVTPVRHSDYFRKNVIEEDEGEETHPIVLLQ